MGICEVIACSGFNLWLLLSWFQYLHTVLSPHLLAGYCIASTFVPYNFFWMCFEVLFYICINTFPLFLTRLQPTMGVSMIGKQRRTPGVLSPREVFFCSPPPSPSYMAPLQNHHHYLPHTTLASTTPGPVSHPPNSVSSRVGVVEAGSSRAVHLKHSTVGAPAPNSNSSYGCFNSSLQSNNSGSASVAAAKGPSETASATAVSEYIGPDGKPLQVSCHWKLSQMSEFVSSSIYESLFLTKFA